MVLDRKDIEIFSSRDNIREYLINEMKYYMDLEDLDLNKASFVTYLINVLSALSANHVFFTSSVYREFFLTKAIQRSSVLNLSAMLGYTPPLATPASVDILITMPLEFAGTLFTVNINGRKQNIGDPEPFRFYAKDGTIFTLRNDIQVSITKSGTTNSPELTEFLSSEEGGGSRFIPYEVNNTTQILKFIVKAIQIETMQDTESTFIIPSLKPYEFFNQKIVLPAQINTKDNQISSFKLNSYANNPSILTEWIYKQSLFLIGKEEMGFTYTRTDTGIDLFFGNGIIGTSPTESDTFQSLLEITKGSIGNVIAGSITKADRLFVEDNTGEEIVTKPVKLTVINASPARNGKDSPTIDEIRTTAISRVRANDRFVSSLDYADMENIVDELPVRNSIHVLKRSDIKNNEVALFTDLLYEDTISNETFVVPTRDAVWIYDSTTNPYDVITKSDVITIGGDVYYSMFDIEVDRTTKETNYLYLKDEAELSLTLSKTLTPITKIIPNKVKVLLSRNTDPSLNKTNIELYYNLIDGSFDTSNLSCNLITGWNETTVVMTHDETNKKFYLSDAAKLLLTAVPTGEQLLRFNIYDSTSLINDSNLKTILKQSLDEFMFSQVIITDATSADYSVSVYDVPVISKNYYDAINQSVFDLNVFTKVANFDVTRYRMLTDFINLKFSNTTGKMNNMLLNPLTRTAVKGINPATLPLTPTVGDRYAVDLSDKPNPWNRTGGFIAEYYETSPGNYSWAFEGLVVNDFFNVTDLDTLMLYNSEIFVNPILDIPFLIDLVVWSDKSLSGSSTALVKDIKNKLIDELYVKFGYLKSIYKSDIIKIVKDVPGVLNVYVKNPSIDIQFLYDPLTEFTQTQLLTYAPDLIYTDYNNISIEVR